MHKQGEVLEEIMANVHLTLPDEGVLSELMYTASESGLIETNIDPEDIVSVVILFQLAIAYGNKVPEEIRM